MGDTVQNVVLFVFIGILIWLYVAAPTRRR
jgi:hypothetical protein